MQSVLQRDWLSRTVATALLSNKTVATALISNKTVATALLSSKTIATASLSNKTVATVLISNMTVATAVILAISGRLGVGGTGDGRDTKVAYTDRRGATGLARQSRMF